MTAGGFFVHSPPLQASSQTSPGYRAPRQTLRTDSSAAHAGKYYGWLWARCSEEPHAPTATLGIPHIITINSSIDPSLLQPLPSEHSIPKFRVKTTNSAGHLFFFFFSFLLFVESTLRPLPAIARLMTQDKEAMGANGGERTQEHPNAAHTYNQTPR